MSVRYLTHTSYRVYLQIEICLLICCNQPFQRTDRSRVAIAHSAIRTVDSGKHRRPVERTIERYCHSREQQRPWNGRTRVRCGHTRRRRCCRQTQPACVYCRPYSRVYETQTTAHTASTFHHGGSATDRATAAANQSASESSATRHRNNDESGRRAGVFEFRQLSISDANVKYHRDNKETKLNKNCQIPKTINCILHLNEIICECYRGITMYRIAINNQYGAATSALGYIQTNLQNT